MDLRSVGMRNRFRFLAIGLGLTLSVTLGMGVYRSSRPDGFARISDSEARVVTGGQTGCAGYTYSLSYDCGTTACGGCPLASKYTSGGSTSLKNVVQGKVSCNNCGKACSKSPTPDCTGGTLCMGPQRQKSDLADLAMAHFTEVVHTH